MAGDLADLERQAGQLDALAVGDEPVGRGARQRHSERGAQIGVGIGQQPGLVAADQQGCRGVGLLHRGVAGNVVDVPVRVENRRDLQRSALEHLEDRLQVEAGIDHQRLPLPWCRLPDDVGHFAEGSGLDRLDRIRGGLCHAWLRFHFRFRFR